MNTIRALLVLMTISFLVACSDDDKALICTTEYVFGITVNLYDSVSGEPVSRCETSYQIVDGQYLEDDNDNFSNDTCETSTSIYAAGERAGTYDITITKTGYETWDTNDLIVNEDECHVNTVTVDAFLVPNP